LILLAENKTTQFIIPYFQPICFKSLNRPFRLSASLARPLRFAVFEGGNAFEGVFCATKNQNR
jgi:hypothetical protein